MGSASEDSREGETQMRRAVERAPPIRAIGASNVVRVAIPADGSIGLDTIRGDIFGRPGRTEEADER